MKLPKLKLQPNNRLDHELCNQLQDQSYLQLFNLVSTQLHSQIGSETGNNLIVQMLKQLYDRLNK